MATSDGLSSREVVDVKTGTGKPIANAKLVWRGETPSFSGYAEHSQRKIKQAWDALTEEPLVWEYKVVKVESGRSAFDRIANGAASMKTYLDEKLNLVTERIEERKGELAAALGRVEGRDVLSLSEISDEEFYQENLMAHANVAKKCGKTFAATVGGAVAAAALTAPLAALAASVAAVDLGVTAVVKGAEFANRDEATQQEDRSITENVMPMSQMIYNSLEPIVKENSMNCREANMRMHFYLSEYRKRQYLEAVANGDYGSEEVSEEGSTAAGQ